MTTQPPRDLQSLHQRVAQLLTTLGLQAPAPEGDDEVQHTVHCIDVLEQEVSRMQDDAAHALKRIGEMQDVIAAIVAFDYSKKVSFSTKNDVFDALAVYLNTLVEDLAASTVSKAYVNNIIESMSDALLVTNEQGRIKTVNHAATVLCGYTKNELVGQSVDTLFANIDIASIVDEGNAFRLETWCQPKGAPAILVSFSTSIMRNRKGGIDGVVCLARDLTEVKNAEEERFRMREAIQRQAILVEELSTPLIPITEHIVVMPLVGSVDQDRAKVMCEVLLRGVVSRRANIAIIDITGMRAMDEAAIQGIISAAQALRLVGAEVVLTGIRAEVAATLVTLDVDLQGIETSGSLQSAIARAFRRQGKRMGKGEVAMARSTR